MIRVIVLMVPKGDESRACELARMDIANDGTGSEEQGSYDGTLYAEYCRGGRKGRVENFRRRRQSVFSLVGAFLKLWGHTKHSVRELPPQGEFEFERPETRGGKEAHG